MGRLPVPKWKVTPHGAFGFVRRSAAEGACPGGYPCSHPGVDLVGKPGDVVIAPEAGDLIHTVWAEPPADLPRPWRGYGPGLVVLKGKSGRYHLLAHLEDDDMRERYKDFTDQGIVPAVEEGQIVGQIGSANHVHWELRKSELGAAYNPAVWADAKVWHHNPPPEAEDALDAAIEPETSLVVVALVVLALTFKPRSWPR